MRHATDNGRRAEVLRLRCDARGLPADAVVVDRLARLALAARQWGGELELWRASRELRELIAFMGLEEVLRVRFSEVANPGSGTSADSGKVFDP